MPPSALVLPVLPISGLAVATADGTVEEPWWQWLAGPPLESLVAIVVGLVVLAILRRLITRTVRSLVDGSRAVRRQAERVVRRTGAVLPVPESDPYARARRVQRAETVGSVLRSSAGLVVGLFVVTALSSINGWNLGPVIASAGVVGVALGFGAQTLVKDFLSGLFMLIEDQYGVGDVVDLGEASGTVEAIGLRVTQLRDLQGTLWYVRNGEVLRVGNKTQGWSRAIVEVRVGPEQSVDEALELLREAAAALAGDETIAPLLLGAPEVTAFEDLSGESVLLRALVKTAPAKQWEVQRALRARILDTFVARGVPLAVPRREVMVERESRPAGGTPPASSPGAAGQSTPSSPSTPSSASSPSSARGQDQSSSG